MHFIILGVFAPNRYNIPNYAGYDISRLKDHYRSLIILKSNLSKTNVEIPFFFDGACSNLAELPRPEAMTEEYYKSVELIN